MNTSSPPPKLASAALSEGRTRSPQGKRSLFDAAAIETVVNAQREADVQDPPQRRVPLMGVIRTAAPLILTRRANGWTDAQIVEFLHELGVAISAETLRVYLSRLRRENPEEPSMEMDQIAEPSDEMDPHAAAAPSDPAPPDEPPEIVEPPSAQDEAILTPPQTSSASKAKTIETPFKPGIDLDEEI